MNLRELRLQSGKTILEVSEVLKVSEPAVRHYEAGIRQLSLKGVLSLARLYQVEAEEIIEAQLESVEAYISRPKR